jgi:pSer/pThr/pTyr-binding forkhead associated (FHA) protein
VIFDLNSTSGTFINGIRIKQALLRAGDVISIANYRLVYGEEDDSNDFDQGSTTEIPRIVDSK